MFKHFNNVAFEISREYIYKTWFQNIKLVLIMFCIIWEDQFLSFDQHKAIKHDPRIDLCQKFCQPWNPNKG